MYRIHPIAPLQPFVLALQHSFLCWSRFKASNLHWNGSPAITGFSLTTAGSSQLFTLHLSLNNLLEAKRMMDVCYMWDPAVHHQGDGYDITWKKTTETKTASVMSHTGCLAPLYLFKGRVLRRLIARQKMMVYRLWGWICGLHIYIGK